MGDRGYDPFAAKPGAFFSTDLRGDRRGEGDRSAHLYGVAGGDERRALSPCQPRLAPPRATINRVSRTVNCWPASRGLWRGSLVEFATRAVVEVLTGKRRIAPTGPFSGTSKPCTAKILVSVDGARRFFSSITSQNVPFSGDSFSSWIRAMIPANSSTRFEMGWSISTKKVSIAFDVAERATPARVQSARPHDVHL